MHLGAHLRRVQLRLVSGEVRHLRGTGDLGRLLLQGVHHSGEGQGRVPKDRQSRVLQDRPLLREEKVWI